MKSVALLGLCLSILLIACNPTPSETPAIRLEITPGAVLLEKVGASKQLTLKAFDAQGNTVPSAQVNFVSSNPSVKVNADGILLANTFGSSRVVVTANGLNASISVLVAQPVAGTTIVSDEQIIGDIRPIDPNAALDVGYRYDVTLKGISPPMVGSMLTGNGVKPIGGKVVAVNGDNVTLEMVPLDEILPGIQLNEHLTLKDAPLEINPAVTENFDVVQTPEGGFNLSLKAGKTLNTIATQTLDTQLRASTRGFDFQIGPLDCKVDIGVSKVPISFSKFEIKLDPGLSFERIWESTHKRVVVNSNAQLTVNIEPVLQAELKGKVTCELELGKKIIPLPGYLGLVAGFAIPFGVGFELSAKTPLVGGVSWAFKRDFSATVQAGVDCLATCEQVSELNDTSPPFAGLATPSVHLTFPTTNGLRVSASLYAFAFVKLEFVGSKIVQSAGGAIGFHNIEAELVVAKAGLKLDGEFGSEETQAKDSTFSSSYSFLFEASFSAGKAVKAFSAFVKLTVGNLSKKFSKELASSPKGDLSVDQPNFKAGDTLTFTVTFTPATLEFPIIGFNVLKVRVYKKVIAANGDVSLVLAGETIMSKGQTSVTITAVATEDGTLDNYVGFVETALLPILRLELDTGCTAPTGVKYCITDLGTLGGKYSFAYNLNNKGQVVGESYLSSGVAHAFIWQNGKMNDLGPFGELGTVAAAYDINDAGQVVGAWYESSNTEHGFIWQNGQITDLGGGFIVATGINETGMVTVLTGSRGAIWQNGQMTDLGTLGGTNTHPVDLNNAGQVVGSSYTSTFKSHGFIWQNGQMTDLGTLGGNESFAEHVNNNAQVVGTSRTSSNEVHGFIWQNGKMTDLGAGTLGGKPSVARGINDAGQVVGQFEDANNQGHAFVWQNGAMSDLNTMIDPSLGLSLLSAQAINNQGQIAGFGIHNGQTRAFLLTPAQP